MTGNSVTQRLLAALMLTCVVVLCTVLIYVCGDVMGFDSKGTQPVRSPCPLPGAGLFSWTDIPATALTSFPGSGNHWTRHLLTSATGLLTGAVYTTAVDIPVRDLKGRAKRVIVVKTHDSLQKTSEVFNIDRCILLVRNPYEALLAEFNRGVRREDMIKGSKSLSVRPRKDFVEEWPRFVDKTMPRWASIYLSWVQTTTPVHVMVYNRMTSADGLERQLRHTLHFLNHTAITSNLGCVLLSPEGLRHRQKADWQKEVAVFSQRQVHYLNSAIDDVRQALEKRTGESFEDFLAWKR